MVTTHMTHFNQIMNKNFHPALYNGRPVIYGLKLLIHSQTSTVAPLKFGNGLVIPSHAL